MTPESETALSDFEGHAGRECGEHRTTGARAWCFNCSQWCYPTEPCGGCELPQLRATVQRLQARVTAVVDALTLLDRYGCTAYTRGRCWDDGARTRGAAGSADAWCNACVARDALNRLGVPA